MFKNRLTLNFSISEATHSDTAIKLNLPNVPDANALSIIRKTALEMEHIRSLIGKPIKINSWYRAPEVNKAVGGTSTSQHAKGEAVDFVSPAFGSPLEICKLIINNKDIIPFDQLIMEHTWVHISFAIQSGKPRNQILSLLNGGKYSSGLTDKSGKPY